MATGSSNLGFLARSSTMVAARDSRSASDKENSANSGASKSMSPAGGCGLGLGAT